MPFHQVSQEWKLQQFRIIDNFKNGSVPENFFNNSSYNDYFNTLLFSSKILFDFIISLSFW